MGRRKIPAMPPPEGFVTYDGVPDVLGINRSTVFRYRKEPDFPQPVRVEGVKRILYRVADLIAWKAARERAAGQRNE